jgi:hypothetical protein
VVPEVHVQVLDLRNQDWVAQVHQAVSQVVLQLAEEVAE